MENAVTQQYDGIILGTVDAAGHRARHRGGQQRRHPGARRRHRAGRRGRSSAWSRPTTSPPPASAASSSPSRSAAPARSSTSRATWPTRPPRPATRVCTQALDAYPDIQVIDQSAMWLRPKGSRHHREHPHLRSRHRGDLRRQRPAGARRGPGDQGGRPRRRRRRRLRRHGGRSAGGQGRRPRRPTSLQFPDAMGIIGVDLMVRHLNGEDDPGAASTPAPVWPRRRTSTST